MAWIFDLCRSDFRHLPRFAIVTAHVFLFPAHLQASSLVKYVTSAATLQGQAECLSDGSIRHFSSAPSSQSDSTEENGYAIRFSLLESSQLYSTTCIVLYAELGYYVNYCLLLTCKVICPDLRGMACWHRLQLAGRAMTCIHWLSRDLRLWLWALGHYFDLHPLKCSIEFWKVKFRMLTNLYTSFFSHWWTTFLSLTCYFYIQGSYVYDINGNKYLDSLAGLWCTALGMCTRFCDNETPFISAPLVMSDLLILLHYVFRW